MAGAFHLRVLTPRRPLFEVEAVSVIAPGSDGYLGILANHAPLITALVPGKLTIRNAEGLQTVFAVSSGFLEVSNNNVTMLVDAAELPGDIDVERARRARDRARDRLADTNAEIDRARAEGSLARAINRIRVAAELGQTG